MSWTEAIAQASSRSSGRVPEARIPDGARNSELASRAGVMRACGMSQEAIEAALLEDNRRLCDPPMSSDEVEKIAASYGKYRPRPAMELVTGSATDEAPPSTVRAALEWPDPLSAAAYHGPLGRMVRAVEEHTEADPVGILGTLLTDVACLLGDARTIHQGAWHAPRLFTVLVGDTAFGRKGTATSLSRDILRLIEPTTTACWSPAWGAARDLSTVCAD